MIHLSDNPTQLAIDVAEWIIAQSEIALAERDIFTLVVSGGSTSRRTYKTLASDAYRHRIDWSRVVVFWGDERTVPPDHNDSNYRIVHDALLKHVRIPAGQIHRMHGEDDPKTAAADYQAIIREYFGDMPPVFDVVLLGMGDDGHTASLFPNSTALDAHDQLVVATFVEKLDTWRITMTESLINSARQVAFIVSGTGKAQRLNDVINGPQELNRLPAQRIKDPHWFIDTDAATELS